MKSLLNSPMHIYLEKIRDATEKMARRGYTHVDEFSLRKELFTDLDEICGYYIKSLSSDYQADYLVKTKNHDKVGSLLADYLISYKSDDVREDLLSKLADGAVDMAMDTIVDEINARLPHAVEDLKHWAAIESATPLQLQH